MTGDRPILGISLMILGCLALSANDAGTKLLTDQLSVGQVLAGKSLVIISVLLLATPIIRPGRMFRVADWRAQASRALLTVAGMLLFVASLAALPLSTAVMLTFVSPLFVTALAPVLLREKVDARSWGAVLTGFAGVLIIIRPSAGGFSYMLMLPLGAALCSALRDMLTRRMTAHETTESMVFYAFLATAIAGLAMAQEEIGAIPRADWWLIAATSIGQIAALFLMIEAVRNAKMATVAPFTYSNLVWVTLFDFALWGHVPRWNVLAGAGVIIAAMLYLFHRSRKAARAGLP